MASDIKITNKIPDSAKKSTYFIKDNVVYVQIQDNDNHVLFVQPINAKNNITDADILRVGFNKTYNTVTINFTDGTDITKSIGNHLMLENGDLTLVRGTKRVIQHLSIGLRLLLGDWVLDRSQGIDYFGGMRAYPQILSAQIKNGINTVEGVQTVLKYSFYIDNDNVFNVNSTIKVGNTEIAVNDTIYTKNLGV